MRLGVLLQTVESWWQKQQSSTNKNTVPVIKSLKQTMCVKLKLKNQTEGYENVA